MKMLTRLATIAVGLALIEAPLMAAKPPVEWDGLKRVVSKRMDLVYVRPNADFRAYWKVMLDPTEVAFQKSWQKDQKFRSPGARVSDRDMQKTISEGIIAANDIFLTAWRKAGYEIVSEPATDVLRVSTGVLEVSVDAPDVQVGRTDTYSDIAGDATLVIEARDSLTGSLLGRAIDQDIAGDYTMGPRNRATNRGDFRDLVQQWAKDAVRGMDELKRLSPVP